MPGSAAVFDIPLWMPPLVAFGISLITCMGGISGAVLLVPLQMAVLGSAPTISATTHLFNVVAIPGGVVSYWREGRLLWPLAVLLSLGTLPGVLLGALVRVTWLRETGPFEMFVAVVLGWIGLRILRDVLRRPGAALPAHADLEQAFYAAAWRRGPGSRPGAENRVSTVEVSRKALGFVFRDQTYRVPLAPALALSGGVGLVGGVYGIGGGAIIAPFLVSYFRLPVYMAAGPALLSTLVTSAAGVAAFQLLAPLRPGVSIAPDWMLGLLLGAGGLAGMLLGGRLQKYVPARAIRWLLAAVTLATALRHGLGAALRYLG